MINNMITHYKTVNRSISNYIRNDMYEWLSDQLKYTEGAEVRQGGSGVEVVYAGEVVTRITAVADRMAVEGLFSSYRTHPSDYKLELLHEIARSVVIEMSYLEEDMRAIERYEEKKAKGELEFYSMEEVMK